MNENCLAFWASIQRNIKENDEIEWIIQKTCQQCSNIFYIYWNRTNSQLHKRPQTVQIKSKKIHNMRKRFEIKLPICKGVHCMLVVYGKWHFRSMFFSDFTMDCISVLWTIEIHCLTKQINSIEHWVENKRPMKHNRLIGHFVFIGAVHKCN